MEIDFTRWAVQLRQLADAKYALRGANSQLAEAQQAFLTAQSTRDRCAGNRMLEHRNPAIATVAEANLAAADERLVACRTEMERVQSRVAEISGHFFRQSEIVRTCTQWAAARGVVLPDGDAASASAVPPTTPPHADNSFAHAVEWAAMESAPVPSSAPVASAGPAAGPPPGLLERIGAAFGLGGTA